MAAATSTLFASAPEGAVLHCAHCTACGAMLFPPQAYGCESCGADPSRLEPADVPARGRLHSFTLVHLHAKLPTPFQVGEIATDAQQLIRCRIEHPDPKIGAPVVGVVHAGEDGDELVFVPATGGSAGTAVTESEGAH
jgi:uncharacterized OB-fold protein